MSGKATYGPYPATVSRIIDGDTVALSIDLGFGVAYSGVCRLYGCNAAEHGTPEGDAATAYLHTLLSSGEPVQVLSHGWDKYGGRFDGSISSAAGGDVVQAMIAAGHAKPWDGQGVKPV